MTKARTQWKTLTPLGHKRGHAAIYQCQQMANFAQQILSDGSLQGHSRDHLFRALILLGFVKVGLDKAEKVPHLRQSLLWNHPGDAAFPHSHPRSDHALRTEWMIFSCLPSHACSQPDLKGNPGSRSSQAQPGS